MHSLDAASCLQGSEGSVGKQFGLGKHEREKLIVGEAAGLVEDGRVEIGLQRDSAALPGGVGSWWRASKPAVEMEVLDGKRAFAACPSRWSAGLRPRRRGSRRRGRGGIGAFQVALLD